MFVLSKERYKDGDMILVPLFMSHMTNLFSRYFEDAKGDQKVQIGNEGRSKVLDKGTIEDVFTSEKNITLVNVLYVPDMNRNLISGDFLSKPGIQVVFESGKLILSKSGTLWERVILVMG